MRLAPSTTTQQALDGVLADIWQRSRAANAQRLAVLEAAAAALSAYPSATDLATPSPGETATRAAGGPDPELAAQAAREAHKLAGGLGTFGFVRASEAARTLEQFWRAVAEQRPPHLEPEQVVGLLAPVRAALQDPLPTGFADDADDRAAVIPEQPAVAAASVVEQVDIVLIEDDPSISEMLAACFGRFDLSVRTFGDGESALQALAGPTPSVAARVILLDYDLPGSDGLAVLRQLRSAGTLDHTRVIMLSLTVARDAVARVINAGVHGYIAKPFQWKTVLERVYACLEQPVPLFVIGPSTRPVATAR